MRRIFVALVAAVVCIQADAQRKDGKLQLLKPSKGTVCYGSGKNEFTTIGPPRSRSGAARTQSANIDVTYDENFTPQAQAAFQAAVDIWESILVTSVTIHLEAHWAPLGPGVLGSAGPAVYLANFDGAPKQDALYPIGLAEKIAGKDLNPTNQPDIVATFNSNNASWHYGLTGSPPPEGKYDLVSIVLHEIGHGLGITHGYSVESGEGIIPDYFENTPVVYETSLIDNTGKNMVNDFTPPSAALKDIMTSGLFYSSPLVRSVNSNTNATIYTPTTYSAGSSIAHLDEDTYGAGNPNSLMTPFIGAAERILDPGPIVTKILEDMGWIVTALEHTPLKNTENATGPYHAVAKVRSDHGYNAGTVKLKYKTTGSVTEIPMSATGNADEFQADLPVGASLYSYFISVTDNDNRTFTNPGTVIKPGSAPEQGFIVFEAGPDTKAPVINHTPKEFITATQDLELQAIVSDNIGIDNVKVEWKLNGVDQLDEFMALVPDSDSTYYLVIVLDDLQTDDKIEYRIRAEDSSVAGNVAYKPSASTYYEVNVVGLGETQAAYSNNFDDLSTADFFGDGFTVSKPDGFNDGAIHSDHPYAAGGADGAEVQLIYNLKTPIRISSVPDDAILKFDEIVLVEPGEDDAAWPSDDFYDYVVVEGSSDGGVNWVPLANGYDSRFNSAWLNTWNSSKSSNNSTATGNPSLYRSHSFNLLDKFEADDEVAFRFRLFSDAFSFGWGWSIDNLKIQIDDIPPSIQHQHVDFVLDDETSIVLNAKIKDSKGIDQILFDYNVNGGEVVTTEIVVNPADDYTQTIHLADLGLEAGDEFQYSFHATDGSGNEASFPSTGFIKTAIISLTSSVDQVITDFTTESPDLTGNFFSATPTGLTNPAFQTIHPYDSGLDVDHNSEFSWLTKKPIKVSSDNAVIYYEDIALVEYSGTAVKDYVVVEASKDGITWEQLVTPYAANAVTLWKSVFDNDSDPTSGMYQKHVVSITESGTFKAGDIILIRFRLHSDAAITGWGWAVDNLSIQGPVTGIEPAVSVTGFDAWPNPVTNGSVHVTMDLPGASEVNVEFLTTQGQLLSSDRFSAPSGEFQRDYKMNDWAKGFYILRIQSAFGTAVKKIIWLNSQN